MRPFNFFKTTPPHSTLKFTNVNILELVIKSVHVILKNRMINPENILKIFEKGNHLSLTVKEIKSRLKVPSHEVPLLRRLLRQMTALGQLICLHKKEYALPESSGLISGILRMNPKGFGFVEPFIKESPDGKEIEDIYIHRENLSSAMHADEVLVNLVNVERREGHIAKILKRANEKVVGTLEKERKLFFVIPDNAKLIYDIVIPQNVLRGARPQDKVMVKITEWPSKHLSPQGEVLEILGKADDPKLDSLVIAKAYGLPLEFPKEVEDEARKYSEMVPEEAYHSRWDLTSLLTLTIDPIHARDFDDAISVEKIEKGWKLGVHIADVSYYVPRHSKIDREAFDRGCTVYFSDRALRMLPEKLSREICSLDQGENRLAKSLLIDLDEEGNVTRWELGRSVIRSRKRFAYEEVTQLLEHAECRSTLPADVMKSLLDLEQLTSILFMNRLKRGALELNIPELEVKTDSQGRTVRLELRSKEVSHQMVEECMLLANEWVACFLEEKKLPGIYRIHPKPSKKDQEDFKNFIQKLGVSLKNIYNVKSLQNLMSELKGKPLSYLVNIALLRSLRVAQYSPKNLGHFALALDSYTHFTSPIRRYPDLYVHQVLDEYFEKNHHELKKEDLEKIAQHSSEMERKADEAEDEFNKLKRLRFFKNELDQGRLGSIKVMISEVKEFGIFVEDPKTLARGLVRVSELGEDFYIYDPDHLCFWGRRTKKKFKVGDEIWVKIVKVDLHQKQMDFKMVK
ncbi:MAG: ribonuclease R [Chlamydiae bacterium]|nr:ribonuclease R [Chlamydiota bacterium]